MLLWILPTSVLVLPPVRGWQSVGDLVPAAKVKPGALKAAAECQTETSVVRNPKADTLKQPTTSDRGSANQHAARPGPGRGGVSAPSTDLVQLTERSSLLVTVGGSAT